MRGFLKSLLNNILPGKKNNDEDDCLKKIFDNEIDTLYQINSKFENDISNEKPFKINITFNPSKKLIDYLLNSKLIIELTYEGMYKRLDNVRSELIENERKKEEYENDDEFSIFHTTLENLCHIYDTADCRGELIKAVHQVGRMPFEEYLNQYKVLIENVYTCKIIENSHYAINTKIDIDKTTNTDEYITYILAKSIIQKNDKIVESFRSSEERQQFADYLNQFMKELCLFILYEHYHSLNDVQKKDYIDYYQNNCPVPDFCIKENSVFEFSNDIQNQYNIRHFIQNKDGMDYYYFKLNVIDDYLIKKVGVNNVDECISFMYGSLSIVTDIECCGLSQAINENTYESSMIRVLCHYDARILSNLANKFFATYFDRQMHVIRDFIQDEVRNKLNLD